MGVIITFGLRIGFLIALGLTWGWGYAVALFIALALLRPKADYFGRFNTSSASVWIRVLLEVVVTVGGLISCAQLWGSVWAAAALIILVIGMVDD